MAIDGAIPQWLENAGAVNHARQMRRILDRSLMGFDVRTAGGLATTGTANGAVGRYYGGPNFGDFAVIQRGAGANMSVDVGLGGALVGGTESAHQGDYFAYNDAAINVPITAADAVNPRIDLIVIRIRDTEYSGGVNNCTVEVVTGTPAGVPAEPTIPANCLTLARVDVAALAASILTANITDRRRQMTAKGGVHICTSTTRPTVNLWPGMVIIETDTVTAGAPIAQVYDLALATWIPLGQYARAWAVITDTLLGGDGVISFLSIPQTFTHLELICSLRSASAVVGEDQFVKINNDAANNASSYATENNSVVTGGYATDAGGLRLGVGIGNNATAGRFAAFRAVLPDYRNASRYKTLTSMGGAVDGAAITAWTSVISASYAQTTAISRLDLTNNGGSNWKAGSRGTLVGIR